MIQLNEYLINKQTREKQNNNILMGDIIFDACNEYLELPDEKLIKDFVDKKTSIGSGQDNRYSFKFKQTLTLRTIKTNCWKELFRAIYQKYHKDFIKGDNFQSVMWTWDNEYKINIDNIHIEVGRKKLKGGYSHQEIIYLDVSERKIWDYIYFKLQHGT